MARFLLGEPLKLVFWLGLLCVILVIAYYVIERVRRKTLAKANEPLASQFLTEFGKMYAKGMISNDEYGTIKEILSRQLQNELKDTDQKDSNE
jgi:uncharacterized membrane protein